jgi:transcriptional regulator with XRE-family HTH domain
MENLLTIKSIIRDKKLSGKEIAQNIGITENAFSLIVNGKRQPRYELLIKIAKALDVDIKELFISTKEKTAKEIIQDMRQNLDELEKQKNG